MFWKYNFLQTNSRQIEKRKSFWAVELKVDENRTEFSGGRKGENFD